MEAETFVENGDTTHQGYKHFEETPNYAEETTEHTGQYQEVIWPAHSEFENGSEVQIHEGKAEPQDEGFGESGDRASIVYAEPGDSQEIGETTEFEELVEQVQDCAVIEPVCRRVKVSVVFSPILFLGEDLYQQKRIRCMIYQYDDSYFSPLDVEDVYLDMKVLVVDDDGVDFQRAIVSAITRVGISVDRLDYFGIKEVTTVYECPEEIQEEKPAVRKYSLKTASTREPLMRGQRLKLSCDFSDGDFVAAEIME